jgi:hypothetical protein
MSRSGPLSLFAFSSLRSPLGLLAPAAVEPGAEHGDDLDHVLRQFVLEGGGSPFVEGDNPVLDLAGRAEALEPVFCASGPAAACEIGDDRYRQFFGATEPNPGTGESGRIAVGSRRFV